MDFVHNLRGKHIVYVLQCEPDEQGNETRYVGCSTNIERRTAEHLGLKAGGAAWCEAACKDQRGIKPEFKLTQPHV